MNAEDTFRRSVTEMDCFTGEQIAILISLYRRKGAGYAYDLAFKVKRAQAAVEATRRAQAQV